MNRNHRPPFTSQVSEVRVSNATLPAGLTSFSPYAIARFINHLGDDEARFIDFKPIWEMLKLDQDESSVFEGFVPADGPYQRWHAGLINASNFQKRLTQVVLKISAKGGESRRYIVFSKRASPGHRGTHWQAIGKIDVESWKFEPLKHRAYQKVIVNSQHTWLALHPTSGGTGVYQASEVWYKIDAEPVHLALEFPVEGYFCNDIVCNRNFDARIVRASSGANKPRIDVVFSAVYNGVDDKTYGLAKRQRARYVWQTDVMKFVLDRSKSELSEDEIAQVYGAGFLPDEEFVKFNFKELANLARRGNGAQKKYIRRVLGHLDASPLKADLQNALNAAN